MPVEQLVSDLPLSMELQQSEDVGGVAVHAREFARPAPNLQVDDRDRLDNFDSCASRLYVRCGPVRGNSFEDMLDRSAVLYALAIARHRRFPVKRWTH